MRICGCPQIAEPVAAALALITPMRICGCPQIAEPDAYDKRVGIEKNDQLQIN
jgi:hypothetical protein